MYGKRDINKEDAMKPKAQKEKWCNATAHDLKLFLAEHQKPN